MIVGTIRRPTASHPPNVLGATTVSAARARPLALVLTLALAATACGPVRRGEVVEATALPQIAVDPPAPDQGPFPVEEGGGATATQVEPSGGTTDPRPVSWDSAHVLEGGDRVEFTWTSGVAPCHVLDRIEVTETDQTVTVTLFEGSAADEAVSCIAIAERKSTVAHLDAPVGQRALIDGAT